MTLEISAQTAEIIPAIDLMPRPAYGASDTYAQLALLADVRTRVPSSVKAAKTSNLVAYRAYDGGPAWLLKETAASVIVPEGGLPLGEVRPSQDVLRSMYASGLKHVTYGAADAAATALTIAAEELASRGLDPKQERKLTEELTAFVSNALTSSVKGWNKTQIPAKLAELSEISEGETVNALTASLASDRRAAAKTPKAPKAPKASKAKASLVDTFIAAGDALVSAVESGEFYPHDGDDEIVTKVTDAIIAAFKSARDGEPIKE